MSFLKNLLGKKDIKVNSYADFWAWFQSNKDDFYKTVKNRGNIEKDFFRKLTPKLAELREGYFFLTGMCDDNTAELVLTADGKVKNFVFVEELVSAAPPVEGWRFTAHKPSLDIANVNINMYGFEFNKDILSFFPVEHPDHPDEIEITVIHPNLNDTNRNEITNGVYIFLDNYLGEVNFAITIDYMTVEGKDHGNKELIPISKLKDYLTWRQKEFIEKYEGVRRNTENDSYSALEARLKNGNPVIATINTDLLKWDRKASHPWILKIDIKYGNSNNNGMPNKSTYALMDEFENEIRNELKDFDGYLTIGRQTANGVREIYYACKDFRKSSKVASDIAQKYNDRLQITYDFFKDKYWRAFDRFLNV
jgi:hypothetical protein